MKTAAGPSKAEKNIKKFIKWKAGVKMSEQALKERRVKFYVEKRSMWVQAAVIFMALSAVFRLIGCWGLWNDRFFAVSQIALPLCCNLLFILCLLLLGRRAFWLTSLPVLLGVIFFIIKSFTFASWIHTILCLMLYLLVAVLYTATAFGVVRTKWFLVPLFGLPFLYHVFVEDLAALRDTANPVTLSAGMQEISVLCVMLALLFTAFAMKKQKPRQEVELPKIKDPKVIPPAPKKEEPLMAEAEKIGPEKTEPEKAGAAADDSAAESEKTKPGEK